MNRSTINLNLGDCMDAMRDMPDNAYDLAIVDPPYGIKETSFRATPTKCAAKKKKYNVSLWKQNKPSKKYFDQLMRVSKNQIVWGGNYFTDNLYESRCWVVWDKETQDSNFADIEMAWSSFQRSSKLFKWRWNGMLQGDMKNKEHRIHPTQKPVALYKWLLTNYATCKNCKGEGQYEEDVAGHGGSTMTMLCDDCYNEHTEKNGIRILDTHLGSGSIAIACHDLGFDLDAWEIDAEYHAAALKRFEQHKAQLQLF